MGTPDSSRIWDAAEYAAGRVVENSKEGFRKMLQEHFPEPDILTLTLTLTLTRSTSPSPTS